MSEHEDAKVSKHYRALRREEPGAALDAAILAASRRAVGARPGGRLRRWTLPVSVAAVVVLSVTLTLQIQRERPDEVALHAPVPRPLEQEAARETPTAPSAPRDAQAPSPQPDTAPSAEPRLTPRATAARQAPATSAVSGKKQEPERVAREPARASAEAVAGRREFAPDPAPATPSPPAGRLEAPAVAPAKPLAERAPAAAAPPAQALARPRADVAAPAAPAASDAARRSAPALGELRAKSAEADESPERWLERIVALRAAGRDREADESYAAFRKRYPDYRISEELLGKLGVPR